MRLILVKRVLICLVQRSLLMVWQAISRPRPSVRAVSHRGCSSLHTVQDVSALLNTGPTCVSSNHRLLSTVAYQLNGEITYALEGSIFVAGAVVQWLRDGLKIIRDASETEALANAAKPGSRVYLVPAFTGLGAPYWDSECRGALFGLTRDTGFAEVARAAPGPSPIKPETCMRRCALDWEEASGGQSDDAVLRVDGGMVANDWMVQSLSDILQAPVDRPEVIETTARCCLVGGHVCWFVSGSRRDSAKPGRLIDILNHR